MGLLDVFKKKKEEWPEQMLPSAEPSEPYPLPILSRYERSSDSKSTTALLDDRAFMHKKTRKKKRKLRGSHSKKKLHRKTPVFKGGLKMVQKKVRSKKKSLTLPKSSKLSSKISTSIKKKSRGLKNDLLDDALVDLKRELHELNSSRRTLEQRFGATSSDLEKVQAKKVRLQTQIGSALEKETSLMKKKSITKDKMMALDQKIQKVKSIQRELKEVDG